MRLNSQNNNNNSILTLLFLASSFVSLSYFIFPVPMRECGKTLVHEFPISYSHTEWYLLFSRNDMIGMVEESPVKN